MRKEEACGYRENFSVSLKTDFVITGGGMSGCCAAITAARKGIRVILIQDRPVLGGNASSEVRLWILGATSHMGNNNRWAREGGVIDEILVENLYRNKEGNPLILDTILLEKITCEPNITLLLNTVVYEVKKEGTGKIRSIKAFCSQNSTSYEVEAPLFCDASGDGIVGFLAGASFRMGAESKNEFGELLAPEKEYGELLGHSIYFYSKRVDKPVKFVPPAFALKNIEEIPRYKEFNLSDYGCRLWWIEYGGRKDTVFDTEEIKWELWKIVYGLWNYIKNSGKFHDVDNLTLEWVGTFPGKRESRRFEGLYMLKQQDIVSRRSFDDAVAFGGWALDLHPAEGVYSNLPGCNQYHSKGIYQIPFRCYVSKDVENLFFAGRLISASHVAFSSSRVMATCALGAQAVGMAAALCTEKSLLPAELLQKTYIRELQQDLNKCGQSIPGIPLVIDENLKPLVKASSVLTIDEIPENGSWIPLNEGAAQLLPLENHRYLFTVAVRAEEDTVLTVELRSSKRKEDYTPDNTLECLKIPVHSGEHLIKVPFSVTFPGCAYGFVIFHKNSALSVRGSKNFYTGITAVFNGKNKAVSNNGMQQVPENKGVESFEFWTPRRRPFQENISMKIDPPLHAYSSDYLLNGYTRPYLRTNAWAADPSETISVLYLQWPDPRELKSITLFFDTDYDHPLESSLMGHPENVIPYCIRNYWIKDKDGNLLFEKRENYQTINRISFENSIVTDELQIFIEQPSEYVPAALFQIFID